MLLMVEKGIRGVICDGIHPYMKVNNKYMNDYDKNNYCILIIGMQIIYMENLL